ncbi:MAG: pyridoxal phosphate-dependent aminotransferase [Polyangiaceae bacterium]
MTARPSRSLSSVSRALGASIFAELAPRIEALRARGESLVTFHIGDTYRSPPDGARFAAHERTDAFDRELYAYGPLGGLPALKAALAGRHGASGSFGPPVDPATEVLVGTGATHAIFAACRAVLEPGDEVLLVSPYWPLAVGILRACGANVVEVPLTQALYADPSLDVGALLRSRITPATRALYFISPNNPDGKVFGESTLDSIARVAEEFDLWIVADEVYADSVFEGEHRSIRAIDGMAARTIVASSFSKSHALAGARVGAIVAPRDVVTVATRVATHSGFNVPVVAQRTALTALTRGAIWLRESQVAYRTARDTTVQALRASGATFHVPEGGSYVFVDYGAMLAAREADLAAFLAVAVDHGVLLCPGAASGLGFERHARLCYTAVPPDELATGLARLDQAVRAFANGA